MALVGMPEMANPAQALSPTGLYIYLSIEREREREREREIQIY